VLLYGTGTLSTQVVILEKNVLFLCFFSPHRGLDPRPLLRRPLAEAVSDAPRGQRPL